MVDLTLLQSVSYIAGAIGVCIGGLSFALNTRTTNKNREITYATTTLNTFLSHEGLQEYYELMSMQWMDFDDFKRKYDSSVNPANYIKRLHYWNLCDNIGWQLRTGKIDWGTVRKMSGGASAVWRKFGPIISEYKERREYGPDAFEDFEYLAEQLIASESSEPYETWIRGGHFGSETRKTQ